MDSKSSRFVDFMVAILIIHNIGSYFLPDHYGVRCTNNSPPMGPLFLVLFYGIWTCFTICKVKNDPLIAHYYEDNELERPTFWANAKQLCLHEYSGEFDHSKMILA